MSESRMRTKVVKILKPRDAIAVENSALPGTQDVNYVEGWIELKWIRSWPKNGDTVVQMKHFTQRQRIRQKLRRAAGGQTHVLLQCKREWLLFDGAVAADHLGSLSKRNLILMSEDYWANGLNVEEFRTCILRKLKRYSFSDGVKD